MRVIQRTVSPVAPVRERTEDTCGVPVQTLEEFRALPRHGVEMESGAHIAKTPERLREIGVHRRFHPSMNSKSTMFRGLARPETMAGLDLVAVHAGNCLGGDDPMSFCRACNRRVQS